MMLEPNVAVLALKAGRPVRWALNMAEQFELGPAKVPHYPTYKLGVRKDGSLTALHRTHIVNVGAYASLSCLTGKKCTMLGSGPYRIPHQVGRPEHQTQHIKTAYPLYEGETARGLCPT